MTTKTVRSAANRLLQQGSFGSEKDIWQYLSTGTAKSTGSAAPRTAAACLLIQAALGCMLAPPCANAGRCGLPSITRS